MHSGRLRILLLSVYCHGMRESLEEIGIGYIASYLRSKGFIVMLSRAREESLDYEEIETFRPDIVGIGVYEKTRNLAYTISQHLRDMLEEVLIVVGGPFPTYCHTELLSESPHIDCAIRGEGEVAFFELAERYEKGQSLGGLKGITYRDKGEIIVNDDREPIPDINIVPWPARDLLRTSKSRIAMISTSRGCLANCSFCSNQFFWKKWRGRTVKNVVDEMEFIVNQHGIWMFNFTDASFEDPDRECLRLRSIAEEIIERGLRIAYLADFRAEFHRKSTDSLISLLVSSGLCGVCVGIESADETDLKIYRKIATVDDNIKVIELFERHGINILPGFITFNPYSSFAGLHKNIDFLEKYGFAASMETVINRYRMYKGSTLQKMVADDGLLSEAEYQYDENGYRFVNSKIERLSDFMHSYIRSIDTMLPLAFESITNQLELFSCFVFQLRRKIVAEESDSLQGLFKNFDNNMNDLKAQLNSTTAMWFRELLHLAEERWDEEEAKRIAVKYLSIDYVKMMKGKFIANANRLQLGLIKENKGYESELVILS